MDDLRQAVFDCGKKAKFSLYTRSSKEAMGSILLACRHYGQPRSGTESVKKNDTHDCQPSSSEEKDNAQEKNSFFSGRIREKQSQRRDCSFSVRVFQFTNELGNIVWKTDPSFFQLEHNHRIAGSEKTYPMHRRITKNADLQQVMRLIESFASNTAIASVIASAGLPCLPKDIANFKQQLRFENDDTGGGIKRLILELQEKGYIVHYSTIKSATSPGKSILQCIFFAHKSSIEWARKFNEVACLDATYRIVKQKLPFVNVVGILNTGYPSLQSFSIAVGWMVNETSQSYSWFVEKLKECVWPELEKSPRLIITDSEQALMDPLTEFFPESTRALCQIHMRRNFRTHLLKYFGKEKYDDLEKAVNFIMATNIYNPITGLDEIVVGDSLYNKALAMYKKAAEESKDEQLLWIIYNCEYKNTANKPNLILSIYN